MGVLDGGRWVEIGVAMEDRGVGELLVGVEFVERG